MAASPKSLIINTPYRVPEHHWGKGKAGALTLAEGRRTAGYEIFDTRANTLRVEPLDLVNKIRERVDAWRAASYPGVTTVTRSLLEHWYNPDARQHQFYFCQLEAIETLIWWIEGPAEHKQGIYIHGDGGEWERLCNKMATGSGKTTVMSMIITWQVLNALTYPKRREFSKSVFVVAPGITVKERLQVLYPGHEQNVYDEFGLCPNDAMRQKINQVEILVENWHQLMPLKQADRSVVRKGKESDEAFTRRVLGKLASAKDIIVINDEAHHAYRIPADIKVSAADRKAAAEAGIDLEEATRWIEGLDRIHGTRRILRCFDLSATPFAPTGRQATEKGLFEWIVSDFGLNDAIEAGLVKTPRVVVRSDAAINVTTMRSKLYHIYNDPDVKDDLNRKAEPHDPLPDLVQKAYALLGADWRQTWNDWQAAGHQIPPVMLTVCNRTETSARVEHFLNNGDCAIAEMQAPERTLRVDSRVLERAEIGETATTDKAYQERLAMVIESAGLPSDTQEKLLELKPEEQLRAIIDNVGKRGKAGQRLQNVISVAMLSEGWDAKNVTHIMGLRAFTSQLLCEQVIGRGLRRVSYEVDENGLFIPEYVNVFGVPLSIFQEVGEGGEAPPPPKPSTQIESLKERNAFEIRWPNVVRIDSVLRKTLVVDWAKVDVLELRPEFTPTQAEIAPALTGQADLSKVSLIDLNEAAGQFRLQQLIFKAARKVYEQAGGNFGPDRQYLAVQLIRIVDQFLTSEKLHIPSLFHQQDDRKRVLIALNIDQIVRHIARFVKEQNEERQEAVFDKDQPIGSTAYMRTWYTTKPNGPTQKSQISHVVYDSSWEALGTFALDYSDNVQAYAKNDHLNFSVLYVFNGVVRKFFPDFLIRLSNGKTLVLEVKGEDSGQNQAKRDAMKTWVKAVNEKSGFGTWAFEVIFNPSQLQDALARHMTA